MPVLPLLSLALLAALLGLEAWTLVLAHTQLARLPRAAAGPPGTPPPGFFVDTAATRTAAYLGLGAGILLVGVGLLEVHAPHLGAPSPLPLARGNPQVHPPAASVSLSTVAAWLGIVAALQTLHTVDNLNVFVACGRIDVAKHALTRIVVVNGVIAAVLALALAGRTVTTTPSGIPAGADALAFVV